MYWNPALLPALVVGGVLYGLGWLAGRRARGWARGVLVALAVLVSLPTLSFALYYAHVAAAPWWYIQCRALPGCEILSGGWGALFGILSARMTSRRGALVLHPVLAVCCGLFVAIPFLKPILLPVTLTGPLRDTWQDGVCIQSTASTCGPATLATIFAAYGERHTEAEIARACYSGASGTELWYLLRYARRHGLRPVRIEADRLTDVPAPALVGVAFGGIPGLRPGGHFIAVLRNADGRIWVGDPLIGRSTFTPGSIPREYRVIGDVVYFRHVDAQK